MDKKQLYESIMSSVAKEVKKALNENVEEYDDDMWFSNYDKIPDEYRDDETETILFDKMSRDEIKQFIANMNFDHKTDSDLHLLSSDYEVYDKDNKYNSYFKYDQCDICVDIPYTGAILNVDATFDWDVEPYDSGDYWNPPSGGDGEISHSQINSITLYYKDNAYRFTRKTDMDLIKAVEDKTLDYLEQTATDLFDYDEYADDLRSERDSYYESQWEAQRDEEA